VVFIDDLGKLRIMTVFYGVELHGFSAHLGIAVDNQALNWLSTELEIYERFPRGGNRRKGDSHTALGRVYFLCADE
jgi:hypothetical protein